MPATFFLVPGLLSRTVQPWWEIAGWAFSRTSSSTIRWNGSRYSLHDSRARQRAFTAAAEMLKRRNRAAPTAAVEELVQRLAPAGDPPPPELFLDWDGARQLVRAGFEIGSHGYDHAILAEETPDDQERDLLRSRCELEAGVGAPVRLLAYPNGTRRDYDGDTVRLARRAGYAAAVTTLPGLNRPGTPLLETRRVVVYPERGLREIAVVGAHLARASAADR